MIAYARATRHRAHCYPEAPADPRDTGQLRVDLGLAQSALLGGQTPQVREQAMKDIEAIRAELVRRGERA